MPGPKIVRRQLPYEKNNFTLIRLGDGCNIATISLDYACPKTMNPRIRLELPSYALRYRFAPAAGQF